MGGMAPHVPHHAWRMVSIALIAGILGLWVLPLRIANAAPPLPAVTVTATTACTSGSVSGYGQDVVVAPEAWVCGDANAYGGGITIEGHVSGNVSAFGGGVIVAGQVDGNVVAVGGNVTLQPGAHVGGDVDSWGGTVRRAAGTFVSGNVDRGQWVTHSLGGPWLGPAHGWVFPWPWILGWSALAAIIVTLFPARTGRVRLMARRAAVRSMSLGLLTAILGLVAAAVLFATCIGIPISLLLLVALAAGWMLGTVAVGLGVGGWMLHAVAPRQQSPVLRAVVGVVVLSGLESIPCAGGVLAVAVSCLGLGATLLSRFGSPRFSFRRLPENTEKLG